MPRAGAVFGGFLVQRRGSIGPFKLELDKDLGFTQMDSANAIIKECYFRREKWKKSVVLRAPFWKLLQPSAAFLGFGNLCLHSGD
jgi:hypothetical protein